MSRAAHRAPRGWLAFAALALTLALPAAPARAITSLGGEYDWMMEMRKDFRAFPWDFDSNDGGTYSPLQLHLFSTPGPGIESWTKFEAAYNTSNNKSPMPEFHFDEADVRFRREMGTRGIDSYLFTRQNRLWVEPYLINYANDYGNGNGLRVDTWGFLKTKATFVVVDESDYNDPNSALRTNDRYVARLRREFLRDKRLRVGMTFNRYETWTGGDSTSGAGTPNSVVGIDGRYRIGKTDVGLEYGQNFNKAGRVGDEPITFFRDPTGLRVPNHAVLQGEIRSIKLGTPTLGTVGVTPQWWHRGSQWSNGIGGPSSDETGFVLQSYYLLPQRSITYTNQLLWYGNKVSSTNSVREIYNELYIEFVNGFTGKTYYRRRDEFTNPYGITVRTTHLTWFNELQVESKLAWMRIQSKLQDIGNPARKQLFAVEDRINLTDKMKIYNRFALGNDPTILRKGLFTQLQYRPSGNVEMYLQYGPDNIGSGSTPVDDGNLAGSGDQYDTVKFILKGSF